MQTGPRQRDLAMVILEELVVVLERHRRQMAPLDAWLAATPEGARFLAGLLEDTDRELGRLCDQLSDGVERCTRPTGGT
jgi:hypothetical protein